MNPEAERRRWSDFEKLIQTMHDWELHDNGNELNGTVAFYRDILTATGVYKHLHEDGAYTWKEMLDLRESMEKRLEHLIPNIKNLIR